MKRLNIILFLLALAVLTVEAKDLKVADITNQYCDMSQLQSMIDKLLS